MYGIGTLKPNAFLEPTNSDAVFPQRKKENNIDFRSSAIAGSGLCVRHTSRTNIPGSTKKGSKFETIVMTRAELELDKANEEKKAKREATQKIEKDIDESNKILSKMAIEEKPASKDITMELDAKMKKMMMKDPSSIAIKKKKSGKRGNKRTLVY